MRDCAVLTDMDAEARLIEWGKSLHYEPWNYWPSTSVLGRIKDEGAGASQSTAQQSDGGYARMVERMAESLAKDRRCREVSEAVQLMPRALVLIVDATYRGCASKWEVPRQWESAVAISGMAQATYFRRKKQMLEWLSQQLCIAIKRKAA